MAEYTYKNNIDIKKYIYKETYINKHIYEKTYIWKRHTYKRNINIE